MSFIALIDQSLPDNRSKKKKKFILKIISALHDAPEEISGRRQYEQGKIYLITSLIN